MLWTKCPRNIHERSTGFCGYTMYTVQIENTSCPIATTLHVNTWRYNIHCPFSPSVLNQGPPPKTDHFNFGNWILRLQSIHTYEHANNTVLTNKQNPLKLKHLKTLLCEFLHTLKSKSPADTTSSPKRIPEPVSSMLPDRLSATKFDKCQDATTLSLVYCKIM